MAVIVVVLTLVSSLAYGTSDFLGGTAARRLAVLPSTLVTYACGTAVVGAALLVGGWAWSGTAVLAGGVAGALAIVGFVTFYAALSIGPISLLAPLIALVQAIVPITAAVLTGQGLTPVGWGAVGIAVVAGLLISRQHSAATERITARGATLALVSAVTLGASVVALDATPEEAGLLPAFLEMLGGLLLLAALMVVLRVAGVAPAWLAAEQRAGTARGSRSRAWMAAAAAGVLLGSANALLMTALHLGNLAVVSVLSSLYPIATVVLAALVLRERISRVQLLGIALAIVAAVVLGGA